jgi:ribosomal protein S18 acetylase RimI-like enzyme
VTYAGRMFAARPATADDVDTILTMMEDFNAIESIAFDRATFAPRLRTLIASPDIGGVLVFTVDGAVAGYAVVTFGYDLEFAGRDAFLTELYVAGTHRGQGVGRQGLAAAEAFARDSDAHALHLSVRHDNAPARALYDASGFRPQPRVLMTKRLG